MGFNRQFWLLFVINFLLMFIFNTVINMLPDYFHSLGASDQYISVFSSAPSLFLVFFVLVTIGRDLGGNRKTLIHWGFFISVLAIIAMAVMHRNLTVMLILRIITGFSYATGFTMLFSLMYDQANPERRTSSAAIFGISGLSSTIFGSAISEYLYYNTDISNIFWTAAAVSLLALILSFFIIEKENSQINPEKRSYVQPEGTKHRSIFEIFRQKTFPVKTMILLLILTMIFGTAFTGFQTFMPRITPLRIGYANTSRYFLVFTIVSVGFRFLSHGFIDRVKKSILFIAGFLLYTGAYVYFLFFQNDWELFIIGLIYGLCHSILFPALSASFVELEIKEKNRLSNIFLATQMIGQFVFLNFAGYLADTAHLEWAIIIFIVLGSLGVLFSVLNIFRRRFRSL